MSGVTTKNTEAHRVFSCYTDLHRRYIKNSVRLCVLRGELRYSLLMLFTGFSLAMRHDFHSTQPMITARFARASSTYTAQPDETFSANWFIQMPLTYHEATMPTSTAGAAT